MYIYTFICNDNNQRKRIASFQELCFEISKQLVSALLIHFYLLPKKCPSVLWTSTHYIERGGWVGKAWATLQLHTRLLSSILKMVFKNRCSVLGCLSSPISEIMWDMCCLCFWYFVTSWYRWSTTEVRPVLMCPKKHTSRLSANAALLPSMMPKESLGCYQVYKVSEAQGIYQINHFRKLYSWT